MSKSVDTRKDYYLPCEFGRNAKFLVEYLKENALEKESIYFLFSRGLNPQLMKELENIAAEMGYPSVLWVETGCTISTHCGPGAFGVGGFVL